MASEIGKYCNVCFNLFPTTFKYCGECGKELQPLKDEKQCPECGMIACGKFCSEDATPLVEIKLSGKLERLFFLLLYTLIINSVFAIILLFSKRLQIKMIMLCWIGHLIM